MTFKPRQLAGLLFQAFIINFLKAIIAYILVFVLVIIFLPIITMQSDFGWIAVRSALLAAIFALIYLSIKLFDTYLYSRGSSITLTDQTLDIVYAGLRQGNQSIPLNDIRSVIVHQSLFERMFGTSRVIIDQIVKRTAMGGFHYAEAKELMLSMNNLISKNMQKKNDRLSDQHDPSN